MFVHDSKINKCPPVQNLREKFSAKKKIHKIYSCRASLARSLTMDTSSSSASTGFRAAMTDSRDCSASFSSWNKKYLSVSATSYGQAKQIRHLMPSIVI
jgi:hypothetical protein